MIRRSTDRTGKKETCLGAKSNCFSPLSFLSLFPFSTLWTGRGWRENGRGKRERVNRVRNSPRFSRIQHGQCSEKQSLEVTNLLLGLFNWGIQLLSGEERERERERERDCSFQLRFRPRPADRVRSPSGAWDVMLFFAEANEDQKEGFHLSAESISLYSLFVRTSVERRRRETHNKRATMKWRRSDRVQRGKGEFYSYIGKVEAH